MHLNESGEVCWFQRTFWRDDVYFQFATTRRVGLRTELFEVLAGWELYEKKWLEGMDLESGGLVDSLSVSAAMQVHMTEIGRQY